MVRRVLLAALVGAAALAGAPATRAADPPAASSAEAPAFRLPAGARPLRYALTLKVIPGEPTLAGDVAIDVELDRPHPVLWLNATALRVRGATSETTAARTTLLAGNDQFVGIAFDPPLPAGRQLVRLTFEAEQSRNETRGVFALQDHGAWYAMTQFEALSARRAFPCFDEPGFKTPWQLALRVPRDQVAIANTRIVSETADDDGLKTVRFAETRPLPSYLVAFAVGPWAQIDLGRLGALATPTRIVVPRGRRDDADFAAHAYPELFARLEDWFAIPYPFDKLDHAAIPLTVNFAMENAGLITYGAGILLAAPGAATPRFRRIAASVGAHEMAHQWFGDLVTPAWWDDLWLNEAFATWMAAKIVDEWRPDYDRGAARIAERAWAIDSDTLTSARRIREPVRTRGDIFNAFDAITYQKGATVIGMFEGWIGPEPFRRGVRRYVDARRDGSATSDDFLSALDAASGRAVTPAFGTFLDQGGVPEIDVELACDAAGARVALTQRRLVPQGAAGPPQGAQPPRGERSKATLGGKHTSAPSMPSQRWQVPVCLRYGTKDAAREQCTLLDAARATVALEGACPTFVLGNAGGRGYYVADYRGDLLSRLAANRDALTTAEYASLVYDVKPLVRAGALGGADALQWIERGASARDRHVVLAAVDLAEFAENTLVSDAERAQWSGFVRRVFGPRARALGFAPKAAESDDDQLLRRALLTLVAPHDAALAAEARKLALAWIKDRAAVDAGMVDVVLVTAGRTGDAAMFAALLAEAKATQDRLDRRYLTMALFSFTDPELATKGLSLLLDPSFDVRESWAALGSVYHWNPARRATSDFIAANFARLAAGVDRDSPADWPHYASGLCSAADEAAVAAFWKERAKDYAGAERQLAQTLESIRICTTVRAKAGRLPLGEHVVAARPPIR